MSDCNKKHEHCKIPKEVEEINELKEEFKEYTDSLKEKIEDLKETSDLAMVESERLGDCLCHVCQIESYRHLMMSAATFASSQAIAGDTMVWEIMVKGFKKMTKEVDRAVRKRN